MGPGQPYFAATTTSQFLTTQWQTIIANVGAGTNQVCVGGFIFDWCDEYWKGGNPNVQQGGPNQGFQGGAFAGAIGTKPGSASPVQSINHNTEITSPTSTERSLPRTPGYAPSILQRRTWPAHFTDIRCSVPRIAGDRRSRSKCRRGSRLSRKRRPW
jgi:hypothetical protein